MHPRHRFVRSILVLALAATLPFATAQAEPFTFQGFLEQAGTPLNGSANLAFKLYDADTAGSQIGSTLSANAWPVAAGVFSIDLDFTGVVFTGAPRWLQVEVNGTPLSGRIAVQPAPLAASANALRGFNVLGSTPTSGQVLKWNGTAWAPAAESGGSSYSAGNGLTLSGTTFSVDFAGSGAANTASRSDHGHYGAGWFGGSSLFALHLANYNAAVGAAVLFANFDNPASTGGVGVRAQTNAIDGIGVYGSGTEGVRGTSTDGADGIGVFGWRNMPGGVGVQGFATGDATTVAVSGGNNAAGGTAIIGVSGNTGSGAGIGVLGKSRNIGGIGVSGEGSTGLRGKGGTGVSAEGVQYGVSSLATDTTGIAVEGFASASSGNTVAVKASVASPAGIALQGSNLANSGAGLALHVMSLAPDGVAANIEARGIGTSVGLHSVSEGEDPDALGVHAQISNSSGAGAALFAEHRSGGVAARLDGVLRMTPRAAAPSSCELGDLYVHDSGALCFCNASGTPGTWEQINATGLCL